MGAAASVKAQGLGLPGCGEECGCKKVGAGLGGSGRGCSMVRGQLWRGLGHVSTAASFLVGGEPLEMRARG